MLPSKFGKLLLDNSKPQIGRQVIETTQPAISRRISICWQQLSAATRLRVDYMKTSI